MHGSSIHRMRWFINRYTRSLPGVLKVLDVGSLDVNGSYRGIFEGEAHRYQYTGLDIQPGRNVDIVLKNPYDWTAVETDHYDIVISGQAFEHIEFFWITLAEMVRALKEWGFLCLVAPSACDEHRYPVDCYRFLTDGMVALAAAVVAFF